MTHSHEPGSGRERQRERGAHHRVHAGLPRVEHLAVEGGVSRLGKQRAGHGDEEIVEQLRVGAMDERDGRDIPPLDATEKRGGIHGASAEASSSAIEIAPTAES